MNLTAVKAFLRGALQEDFTDGQLEALVELLLSQHSTKWYHYRCINPGCGAKVFSSEELTECYCHGEKMERQR